MKTAKRLGDAALYSIAIVGLVHMMATPSVSSDENVVPPAIESDLQTPTPVEKDALLSLDEVLAYAAVESPALESAFYAWQAELERSGYADSLPTPAVNFGWFIRSVETRVGPQKGRISFRQSFPWFGTLEAKKDQASEGAEAAFRRYQSEKLKLFYSVKSAYYDYYYLGREIALTRESFELMEFWESVARTRYKVALRQHPDILKAQVELGKLEDRMLTLEERIKPTVARIRALSNLPESVDLPMPTEIEADETDLDRDSIVQEALANNPDLKSLAHLMEQKRLGQRLADKASRPGFSVGLDYIATGAAVSPTVPQSGKDAWIVNVGIDLPLWFGSNDARKAEAAAKVRAAASSYRDAQNRLEAFVEQLIFEYSDALRKMKLYRDGLVPKAEQALNTSYTAYQAAEADFLYVLDAQRELLAFELERERARSDLATHRAEIEMVIGKGLEP
jgi:outer membrane protein TolC